MKLQNKVAIVTGASGGIGAEIVRVFVAEGAKVAAVDRDAEGVASLATQYDGTVLGLTADVTNYAAMAGMVDAVVDYFGTLDIMINNAGIGTPKALLEHDPETDFDPVTDVNQRGVYHGILAAGRKMAALHSKGVILNTSSVYGRMAAEMSFSYNVSKAAVDMMTKCAALEFARHGIRVAAVAPGRVDTPMLRQYETLGLWEHIRREQMRDQFTMPSEIARVFAFLASEEANCLNGMTVNADDGFTNFKYPLLPRQD
jgi:NAD(P)-dependent dehydrogenase (short-subunit alcohol dehydrogenase family)